MYSRYCNFSFSEHNLISIVQLSYPLLAVLCQDSAISTIIQIIYMHVCMGNYSDIFFYIIYIFIMFLKFYHYQ